MARTGKLIASGAVFGVVLETAVLVSLPIHLASAQGVGASGSSTVSGPGTTLRSVSVDFPDPGNLFAGDSKAGAINNNCLACHSADMVLYQPHLARADWLVEVEKMRDVYKAPIDEADFAAIVDYLANLNAAK
jgi:hypothetical protein